MKEFPTIKVAITVIVVSVVTTVFLVGFRDQAEEYFGLRFGERRFTQPPIEIFPDMDRQLKVKSQKPSLIFADRRGDRMPVAGTVPKGIPVDNPYLLTGRFGNRWGDGIPLPVDKKFIERGRERFDINCAVCHGKAGLGNGTAAQYTGLRGVVASLHQERIIAQPDGQIYNTIVHGKGQMMGYPHISLEDRWAIVAYVRSLQNARMATIRDVPPELQTVLLTAQAAQDNPSETNQ